METLKTLILRIVAVFGSSALAAVAEIGRAHV
jgi:hypothetical protein